jgi:formylglycine-generating enzyme required for sulfatase activity
MKVFGIEMVYIPEESFYVGDGSTGTPPNSQNSFGDNNSTNPRLITSENALSANALEHVNMGAPTRHLAIPADFPKGYAAFYCMKYEISQDQYVRFLNTLAASQQSNRTAFSTISPSGTFALASSSAKNRNFIKIITPSSGIPAIPAIYGVDLNDNNTYNEPDDGLTIACNYLSWNDLTAYLDWAALRPITELEFEKAARGPSSQGLPVIAQFAWGTTNITAANAGSINNAGEASEISTLSGNGLCANGSGNTAHGPLRVGFAATNSTNRQGAGSSYYGVLDLSGNVWEQCVHVGYNSGVGNGAVPIFNGSNGDGTLDTGGNADVSDWGLVGRSVVRGGNWFDGSSLCQISNRQFVTSSGTENGNRNPRTGGRGGR